MEINNTMIQAAADEHANSEGDNGNATQSFITGALWAIAKQAAEIEKLKKDIQFMEMTFKQIIENRDIHIKFLTEQIPHEPVAKFVETVGEHECRNKENI